MPKKTAYSRSAAQRSGNKPRQKSFELVRPTAASDVDVLETKESSKKTEVIDEVEEEEIEETDEEEEGTEEEEEEEVVERVSVKSAKEKTQTSKRVVETESLRPVAAAVTASSANNAPKSAAARMAARRQASQKEKNQRTAANLILAENYAYVRKDLVFILVLALVMLAIILTLHFIPSIGGTL